MLQEKEFCGRNCQKPFLFLRCCHFFISTWPVDIAFLEASVSSIYIVSCSFYIWKGFNYCSRWSRFATTLSSVATRPFLSTRHEGGEPVPTPNLDGMTPVAKHHPDWLLGHKSDRYKTLGKESKLRVSLLYCNYATRISRFRDPPRLFLLRCSRNDWSEGFIWATPEYHLRSSSSLKLNMHWFEWKRPRNVYWPCLGCAK